MPLLSAILAISTAVSPVQSDQLPRKPMLGAQFQPNTTKIAGIVPGGSAEGVLQVGDEISAFGTASIGSPQDITNYMISAAKSGETVTVTLKRGDKTEKIPLKLKERPREVSPDYDVIYSHIVSNGKRIRTIITKPKKAGKFPVFMMLQGLGQFSMDYPLSGNGPYSNFLRHFAKQDFVTLRVEKPGMGDAEGGPYVETDFVTEGDVYLQAIRAIKKESYVNPERVFMFGHSMGGTIGPWVVSQEPIFGFIPSSTIYKTWTEYWLENVRRQMDLGGASREAINNQMLAEAVIQPLVLVENWSPAEVNEKFPQYKAITDSYFAADPNKMMGRTLKFWRQLAQTSYPELWSKISCRTLVLWGQYDFVSTEEDHMMIRDHLNRQNPGTATYIRIENSNHGYQQVSSYQDAFTNPGAPFNNKAVEVMDAWIKEQLADAEKK